MVARGEVWDVALNPTRGAEIQKTRPCVVVSRALWIVELQPSRRNGLHK